MSDRSQLIETGKPFIFDAQRDAEFERLVKRYPTRESMILPALWLTQEQEGWISAEAMAYIADRIGTYASAGVRGCHLLHHVQSAPHWAKTISVFVGHSPVICLGNKRLLTTSDKNWALNLERSARMDNIALRRWNALDTAVPLPWSR